MKKYRIWLLVSIICFVLGLGLLAGSRIFHQKTRGIEDTQISTGQKNRCLAYDAANDIMFVGTHDNILIAFQEEKEIWRVNAGGAYNELKVDETQGLIYAGNEDSHIYVYRIEDGSVIRDINVSRRVISIDVTEDGQLIAVATSTGTSKANVLLYQADGTNLINLPYTIKILGVKFSKDQKNLIIVNNRGEIIKMDLDGNKEKTNKTNYSILQMVRMDDDYVVVCKNGAYYRVDDDLNIVRSGIIINDVQATIKSVGIDTSGSYVLVGTQEGYLYIMNGKDQQIYTTDIGTEITSFISVDKSVYMTGLGDFVKKIYVDNLKNISLYGTLAQLFRYISIVLLVVAVIGLGMAFPASHIMMVTFVKKIWKHRMAYIMLLPTFLLVYLFNYRGIGVAFIRAFTNWSTTNNTVAKMDFVGFENFRTMLTEGYFVIGMKNLVLIVFTGIIKVLTIPVLLAWLVYSIRGSKRKYLHRFLFVLPIVVPGVISALTWQKIYDPSIGLLNQVLGAINLQSWQKVWLGDAKTAIWAVIFMGFPFVHAMAFLVYYGGLISIGKEIEESAKVDGASRWHIFWKIQLPLIRSQLSIMVTLTIIGAMQDFNGIYILTGGGPGTSTYVPALELYFNVAQFGRYGYACALGVILFLFTMFVTLLNMKLTKVKE